MASSTDGSRDVEPHEWPGERNPSQWDVHDAHQVPEASFLRRFKAAVLLSDDAVDCRQYLARAASADPGNATFDLGRQYAYPVAVLSDLPSPPDSHILDQAQLRFEMSFKRHVFMSNIAFPQPSSKRIVPPYLKLGLACLGLAASSHSSFSPQFSASDLFLAGDGLWGVMMEVDNREARLLEAVLAGTLFATYGTLSANEEFWDLSSSTIAGTATMARRVRMDREDISASTDIVFLDHSANTSSLLMAYLFLTDVTRAIHCGRAACISTKELFMRMPASPYNFHHMYNCLISGARPLPSDLQKNEDSMLLLIGICADIVYLQHAFSRVKITAQKQDSHSGLNPYSPLSPTAEALHHHYILNAALARWHQHFKESANRDVLMMFYFCRLLLAFPEVLRLPNLSGYSPSADGISMLPKSSKETPFEVSDEAVSFAWLVLDNSDARGDASGANLSIWLPVVVFLAALTIWYHLQRQSSTSNLRTGTLRILSMFKDELAHLPWPCCVEMCRTLDRLMGNPLDRIADQGRQDRQKP